MRRHRGLAIAIAALVVLSGCSSLAGGGDQTPTAEGPDATQTTDGGTAEATETEPGGGASEGTAEPTATEARGDTATETASATTTAADSSTATATESSATATATPIEQTPGEATERPPGVAANGSVNETALVMAHFERANGTAWKVTHRNNGSETVVVRRNDTALVRNDRGTFYTVGNATVSDDSLFEDDYRFTYESNALGGGDRGSAVVFALAIRLGTGDYRWTGAREVDGTRLHELEMTGPKGLGSEMGHYTGSMLVDDEGRIHDLRGEVGDNESTANEYAFEFDWGVDSVPEPDFLDAVPRGTAEKTANGTALNVTMTGGPAIPAGTELRVTHNRTRDRVTLDEPLAPGETLYVGVRGDGDERTVVTSREPLAGDDLVNLTGSQTRVDGTPTIDGNAVTVRFTVGQFSF